MARLSLSTKAQIHGADATVRSGSRRSGQRAAGELAAILLASLGGFARGESAGAGESPVEAWPAWPRCVQRRQTATDATLTIHASFTKAEGQRPAQLSIMAQIPAGWHIYSITQRDGGPNRTRIDLKPSDQFRLRGFRPRSPAAGPYREGRVRRSSLGRAFGRGHLDGADRDSPRSRPGSARDSRDRQRPALLDGLFAAGRFSIHGSIGDAKKPAAGPAKPLPSPLLSTPPAEAPPQVGQFKPQHSNAILRGWLEPAIATPGSTVKLVIGADPEPGVSTSIRWPTAIRASPAKESRRSS